MSENLLVPTMAEIAQETARKYYFGGCAGSFDDRAKITKAFVRILNRSNVSFAVLVPKRVVQVIQQKSRK
jgi:Fe-S oxidoreductase